MLNLVGEGGTGTSPADLARRLNVDVTTTMRTAASLVARGLLSKEQDASDGRRSVLTLTPEGREVHGRMHKALVDQVIAAFDSMPPQLRAGLVKGLAAFVSATAVGNRERS